MKQYVFEIIIRENNDEFWEELNNRGTTGCEEVKAAIKSCLDGIGFFTGENENNDLILRKFSDVEQD